MKIFDQIVSTFSTSYKVLVLHEDFEKVNFSVKATGYNVISKDSLSRVINYISNGDSFHLSINYLKPIVLETLLDVEIFVEQVNNEFSDEEDIEDVPFDIELNIYKKIVGNTISIYSIKEIIARFKITNFQNVLSLFSKVVSNEGFPHFNLVSDKTFFYTDTIYFYHNSHKDKIQFENVNRQKIISKRITNCNFLDEKEYEFIPEDFHWRVKPEEKEFQDLFKLLEYVFSVVSLANISSIRDNNLEVTFDGYKKLKETIDCKNILNGKYKIDVLIETYNKCYSGGEISDKIGIVRNLLPINVENSILQVKPEFNVSIDSNYKIYLKENVVRYIEIKERIVQNLTDAIQKSNDISGSFYDDLKKNLFAFLTFFISILIFNTTNTGKLQNIFTHDISSIAYALLFISFLFLLLSLNIARRRKKRFCENYESLKTRYKDLLDETDINNIFNKGEEHTKNKSQINRSIWESSVIWLVSIFLLCGMVYYLQIPKIENDAQSDVISDTTVILPKQEIPKVTNDLHLVVRETNAPNEEVKNEIIKKVKEESISSTQKPNTIPLKRIVKSDSVNKINVNK